MRVMKLQATFCHKVSNAYCVGLGVDLAIKSVWNATGADQDLS